MSVHSRDLAVTSMSVTISFIARDLWLSSLPKFSTKPKSSKVPAKIPPHHSIKPYKEAHLSIEPIHFKDTQIFEVRYLPPSTPATLHPSATRVQASTSSSSTAGPSEQLSTSFSQNTVPIGSPEWGDRIKEAAKSNPTLKNLIDLNSQGKASPDQQQTLSLLIQTFMNLGPEPASATPASPSVQAPAPAPPPPVKDFDIVLEFAERPTERVILPRFPAVLDVERNRSNPYYCTLHLRMAMHPYSQRGDDGFQTPPEAVLRVVHFKWESVTPAQMDLFTRWGGTDEQKIAENKKLIAELTTLGRSKRKYLHHQLPPCDWHRTVQDNLKPQWTKKSIKPTPQELAKKRRYAHRTEQPKTPAKTPSQPTKRRKSTKTGQSSAATPFACHHCGKTDVPLLMGGRYCRECFDSGKGVELRAILATPGSAVPPTPPASALQVHMYTPPATAAGPSQAPQAANPNGAAYGNTR
ncbi:hypothetical protein EIP91_011529 [Steccherinum ochraceum]|uniref:Uncharacterized protein n=1 Tax=Steccherinum ochraceum TaxID=92696 RepID=A0A4V6N780_9APHY|nr:hypothetical protein EIP91_011529 [Steccherinum ochraceum]